MRSEPTPLLELQGVSHRFGANVALSDAAIAVRPGSVHALLGENGAGKTTLMRVAFGLISPDAGTVIVSGRTVALHTPADAIACGIGMVHQHFSLVPAMTVAENVALGGRGRFTHRRTADAVRALSVASGLAVDPDARVATLTVAQQQRVEILKALHRNVRVLVLDEPTAGLAPAESDELLRWVQGYVALGNAAVLITHKLREALTVSDEVTVLRRGAVVCRAPVAAVTTDTLTRAMVGDATPDLHAQPEITGERPTRLPAGGASVAAAMRVSAASHREHIDEASFELRGGTIVGVAGVEGAGHHLLLRILARRVHPASGVLTLPKEIAFLPEDRQRDAIIEEFSVAENLALRGAGARRGRMHWDRWRRKAAQLAEVHDVRFGASGDADADIGARVLSGGNQQKLVVARELSGSPSLVVAENPTRGLDVRASAAVRALLRDAARGGAAVVVYSPDLDEMLALADRVLVVHAGRVEECACRREAVGRAMLGAG